jgi:hypothetical protein
MTGREVYTKLKIRRLMESIGVEPEKPLKIWYQNRRTAKAYKKRRTSISTPKWEGKKFQLGFCCTTDTPLIPPQKT